MSKTKLSLTQSAKLMAEGTLKTNFQTLINKNELKSCRSLELERQTTNVISRILLKARDSHSNL